ncbi:Gfo/Idh/MocA family protein [Microlunatus sp. GCM10028923]|uniref:Gfo/Idh/MocA family protein n=1 Tax=Microlunatus sp. GCM10028923 TaxID=3273400 RepID=UPI00361B4B4F
MIDFALVGVADQRHRLFIHPVERRRAGVHVVGYSEPDETARAEFAVLHETPAFADHRELLEQARPSMIAVASPAAATFEVVRDALAAGVDVIVAPPLTGSLAELDQLADAATSAGLRLAVVHTYRNHPAVRLARELVDQGRLGRVREVVLEVAGEVSDADLAGASRETLELYRWFTGASEGTVTGGAAAGEPGRSVAEPAQPVGGAAPSVNGFVQAADGSVQTVGEPEEQVIMTVRGTGPDGDSGCEVVRHPGTAGTALVVQLIGDEGAAAWEVRNGGFRSITGDRPSPVIACGLPADEPQWVLTDLVRRPAPSTVAEQLLSTRISLLVAESGRQGGAELEWRL